MIRIIDKTILWIFGVFLVLKMDAAVLPVLVVLTALTMGACNIYFSNKKIVGGILAVYLVLCIVEPAFTYFLPLVFYDSAIFGLYWGGAGVLLLYPAREMYGVWEVGLWTVTAMLSVIMAVKTKRLETLKTDMIHLRDTSTELNLLMTQRNRELMEKQDSEVHVATLRERNRIAREIHDNVGHMLSRSILQIGALSTIYKEDPIHQQLLSVNETLNTAMNNIRESVHDLHDDSIDLKQAILEATKEMRKDYQVNLEYDMAEPIPRKVKYCFIATVKEAMSNIVKHSNADRVEIIFREHPAFYQLCIEDNGQGAKINNTDTGIGLVNMKDRVEALHGTLHINTEKGFRILISIRKMEEEVCEQ